MSSASSAANEECWGAELGPLAHLVGRSREPVRPVRGIEQPLDEGGIDIGKRKKIGQGCAGFREWAIMRSEDG